MCGRNELDWPFSSSSRAKESLNRYIDIGLTLISKFSTDLSTPTTYRLADLVDVYLAGRWSCMHVDIVDQASPSRCREHLLLYSTNHLTASI